MLKRTIKFTDYNGVERTEEHYFNLTKAEVAEMQMTVSGGLDGALQRMLDAQDGPEMFKFYKEFILKAYGRKSPDGRKFEKTEELRADFLATEAYSDLFMELCTDGKAAAQFVMGVLPAEMVNAAKESGQLPAEFLG